MSKNPTPAPVDPTGRIMTLGFGVLVVVGLIALIALAVTHRNAPVALGPAATATPTATPLPRPAETPGMHFKPQGHPGHDKTDPKQPGVATFAYNSDPPTSGMHLEQFSPLLINATPLPKYLQVHLLEHGNVLMQYNCKCPDIAGALAQIASSYNNQQLSPGETQLSSDDIQRIEEYGKGVIVAPYPPMKYKIALTAWTRLEPFDSIDQAKMIRFINAYLSNTTNAAQ
ncbi:MAG TPA: DUF3105 domain-containing protein [Candidatus Eremiobacteraceae bacterium]|nr:DUF3105 domain-containing protein [Candidatus Eremiobacteraceae bacterium]